MKQAPPSKDSRDYEAKYKYAGDIAEKYNKRRVDEGKWQREQKEFRDLLAAIPPGSSIIDVPVGTGRLIPFYKECGLAAEGVDISEDMLREAGKEADAQGLQMNFRQGSADELPHPNFHCDYVICARLLNWVPFTALEVMLNEFARVAKMGLIVEIRVTYPLTRREYYQTVRTRLMRRPATFVTDIAKKTMWRKPTTFYLHNALDVLTLFDNCGLHVVETRTVDRAVKLSQDVRTHLNIYSLKYNRSST
ncbi:class I SAM-dependent methyltransferase [Gammaproteobacteria bacterium]|nr:class I SAM-dependent methyltransferase [Gammaproteobacteria bacterium]